MHARLMPLLILALIAPGCSGTTELGADAPAAEPTVAASITPEPELEDRSTPTPPADRVPTPPPTEPAPSPPKQPTERREVPPLRLPPGGPGTDRAYEAMIEELEPFVTDEQVAAGVPWPNLRTSDPIAAYRSCAEYQQWMAENNPNPVLVEAYTAAGSPERGFDLDIFASLHANGLVATPSVPPYVMEVRGLVHPAATDITDALLAAVPEGSAAVVYYDSVGVRQLVRPDGSVFGVQDGWVNVGPWVAIMAPTEFGWQVWWDELTDAPPPGLEDERDSSATPPPRSDV